MSDVVKLTALKILRDHLTEELLSFNEDVPDDAPLEDYGLDSAQTVALVLFLEEQFRIQILDEEITAHNLGNVQALVAFIERKLIEKKTAA